MPYDITDRSTAITELQELLRSLSAWTDGDIKSVMVTGTYNAATKEAVSEFQSRSNLPVTGVVDYGTWRALTEMYDTLSEQNLPAHALFPFPDDPAFALTTGMRDDLVYIVQVMLNTVNLSSDLAVIPVNGVYDARTSDAVKTFQRITGYEQNGRVDKAVWNRLCDEYNMYAKDNV